MGLELAHGVDGVEAAAPFGMIDVGVEGGGEFCGEIVGGFGRAYDEERLPYAARS